MMPEVHKVVVMGKASKVWSVVFPEQLLDFAEVNRIPTVIGEGLNQWFCYRYTLIVIDYCADGWSLAFKRGVEIPFGIALSTIEK